MLTGSDLNVAANVGIAIAAVTASIVGVLNFIETKRNGRAALAGRTDISNKVAGVSQQVTVVDVKADGMLEQTNGHMKQLIEVVKPLNPEAAEIAVKSMEESAVRVTAKVSQITGK